ncbi:MAG TPA: efflux transporter outer membrane subunit [Saprospiraceae bacterium]|nr:efflux transporter outer membrane subunit [Saprospiraceae bacterium]
MPAPVQSPEPKRVPSSYGNAPDTMNTATIQWRNFFADQYLTSLIDTALQNNQELLMTLQEIEIARNDIRVKKGQLLPSVAGGGGIGIDKVGRYTSQGAGDASTEITPGKEVPEWLPDQRIGIYAKWEVDIWKKLRNAKKAAITRYLATIEGKNFVVTNLIAEIANSYYELLALDNQLEIVRQTIQLQQNALKIVEVQKQTARVTELAVKKFEAEVLNSQSLEFDILQKIKERENAINFLLGRYPQPIARDRSAFLNLIPQQVQTGIPSQLLNKRPDIRQAELELSAAQLDVKVARAEFYPSFEISSSLGFDAFNPTYLFKIPESLIFSLAGDLAGPLINKNAIAAEFNNANARQIQALYNYDKTILNAYIEVSTELSNLNNLEQAYRLKAKEVDALTNSVDISNDLFKSARADYLEVLMTQRDALESKLELIETKLHQFNSVTNIYRSLGGGWN